ncbi:probable WRKY transcription factor 69 isoform X1 [Salvia hispanica]|uniref:probable WRKY transcription factor 69 isoform X1 n=1 Tax=Salvia hispanica TaxID=49212 RepID=UPI002009B9AA|nr:probable WRKY transcription factor 69 isoform X1 [Salvia hispanica]
MEGGFDDEHDEASAATPPRDNTAESPVSGDEEAYAPSPKKSRRGANKRVVTVPIGGGDGSRSKTEVYPPPDSWSWRKYGQKPIKGSPYPRGYYKCSSSKGCPARKQVERSRLDPTTLLITYSCNHNHPLPTTTKNHHHHQHHKPPLPTTAASSAAKTTISSSSSDTVSPPPVTSFPPEPTSSQPDVEPCPADDGFVELAGELGWLCDVVPATTLVVVPTWGGAQADMEFSVPIGEEDKLLFGDLGDLPESSMVFRRHRVEAPCCAGGTG